MTGEAHRGVVFTLKAQTDESVGSAFNAMTARTAQLQKMLGDFHLGGLDVGRFQTSVDRAHAAIDALHQHATEATAVPSVPSVTPTPPVVSHLATYPQTVGPVPTLSIPTSTAAPSQEPPEAAAAPKPPVNPTTDATALKTALERIVDQHKAAEARMTAASTNGAAGRTAANGHAAKIEAEQEKELTRQDEAETEKRATLPERVIRNRIAVLARLPKLEEDEAAKELAEADKAIARLQKHADAEQRAAETSEIASRKGEEAQRRMTDAVEHTLKGVLSLGQAFVELGLVGEEDLNKVKDTFLPMQPVAEALHGAVELYKSVREGVEAYRQAVEAAEKAEKALAVARAASAAAGGAGKAATTAEGAATAAGAAGGGSLSAIGSAIAKVITPTTIGVGLMAAAIYTSVKFGLDKWKEESERGAKEDAEKRKRELEIREAQNAVLLQIFAAEKRAREQTAAREALALNVSQEFGGKRGQYEAEAEKRGYKGQARKQFITDRAAIDQNELALKQAREDLAKTQEKTERSRNAEHELPTTSPRFAEIAKERAKLLEKMRQDEVMPRIGGRRPDRKGALKALDEEEAQLRRKAEPGRNSFGADPEVEKQAVEEEQAIRQRIDELELRGHELSRDQFRHEVAALNEELEKQQLVEGDEERVKSAREYAEQKKKALTDAFVGFASLSKSQQKRAVSIQEKLDRGENLSHSEQEFGRQHLGERGRKQIEDRMAGSVDPRVRDLLFGGEKGKADQAEKQLATAVKESTDHIKQLTEVMARIADLNAHAAGGEKAHVDVDAKGHATLTIKWDENTSQLIARAMKPELAKWQEAIDEMLANAVAEVKQTFARTVQRKAQTTKAGP